MHYVNSFQIFCIICVHFCIVIMVHLKSYNWIFLKNIIAEFVSQFFVFVLFFHLSYQKLCVFFKINSFFIFLFLFFQFWNISHIVYCPFYSLFFWDSYQICHIASFSQNFLISLHRFLCNFLIFSFAIFLYNLFSVLKSSIDF